MSHYHHWRHTHLLRYCVSNRESEAGRHGQACGVRDLHTERVDPTICYGGRRHGYHERGGRREDPTWHREGLSTALQGVGSYKV